MTDIAGIVLAGGQNSRMGTDKALLTLGPTTLLERASDSMRPLIGQLILSTNRPVKGFNDAAQVSDLYRGVGPLGGLHAALSISSAHKHLVLSCDTPFVPTGLFRYLLQELGDAHAVMPTYKGNAQPLIAIYTRECLPVIQKRLNDGKHTVWGMARACHCKTVSVDELLGPNADHVFLNVNKPEDYEQARQLLATGLDL